MPRERYTSDYPVEVLEALIREAHDLFGPVTPENRTRVLQWYRVRRLAMYHASEHDRESDGRKK